MGKKILLICASFLIFTLAIKSKSEILGGFFKDNLLHFIIYYIVAGIPIFATVYYNSGRRNILKEFGLTKSPLQGFLFSIVSTLPLLIGSAFLFRFTKDIEIANLLRLTIVGAFFEELYFRGFLFNEFFKRTKLGFIPSILIGALLFAVLHLYQAHNFSEVLSVFLATFLGSVLFAWLFVEWKSNLWVPIFLHTFMNLIWSLFSVSSNAGGGLYSNVLRICTIIIAILITIYWKKRNGEKFHINKGNLWMKQNLE